LCVVDILIGLYKPRTGCPEGRQNIVFVYATRIILQMHNVSGIAFNTLLVGYPEGSA